MILVGRRDHHNGLQFTQAIGNTALSADHSFAGTELISATTVVYAKPAIDAAQCGFSVRYLTFGGKPQYTSG